MALPRAYGTREYVSAPFSDQDGWKASGCHSLSWQGCDVTKFRLGNLDFETQKLKNSNTMNSGVALDNSESHSKRLIRNNT